MSAFHAFHKLQLVSEEELNRLRQKQIAQYNPKLPTAAFLKSEIDELMSDKQMEPESKLRLLQLAQQRFTSLRGKHAMERTSLGGIRTQIEDDIIAPPVPPQQDAPLAQGQQVVQQHLVLLHKFCLPKRTR